MTPSGMINNVSEYRFVTGADIDAQHPHGDLDRIIINGGIMPLRDTTLNPANPTNWKKCLRGEDIAFLLEGLCDRRKAQDSAYTDTETFSRAVSHSQLYNVAALLAPFSSLHWLKSGSSPSGSVVLDYGSGSRPDFYAAYPGLYLTAADFGTSFDPSSYTPDSAHQRSVVATMFDDLALLNRFVCEYSPVVTGGYMGSNSILDARFGQINYATSLSISPPVNQSRASIESTAIVLFAVESFKQEIRKWVFAPVSTTSTPTPQALAATIFGLAGISNYTASDDWCVCNAERVYAVGAITNRTRWQTP